MNTKIKTTNKDLLNQIELLKKENTALKTREIEVNKAKEFYLKVLEDFPALIWRANTEKLCDYFNSTWLKFTGRTMQQEYGNGWTEGVHPEDLEGCFEVFSSNFDKHQPFSMEYRLKNYEGEYRWILDMGRPFYDLDQTFLGYIGACYDVTEKRNNEQRLEVLTITDPLTQIFNRFKIDGVLEKEIHRSQRYLSQLSIIMIDIDNFKQVNDDFGHTTGDLILSQIAQILQNNIRETDTLGRWGGEEFMIICPENDAKETCLLAEKLRGKIEEQTFPKIISKTCSFGVAEFNPHDNHQSLLKRADKALYAAKNNGKNQVKVL